MKSKTLNSMDFSGRFAQLTQQHAELTQQTNPVVEPGNGIYHRFKNPVVTAAHVPINWRFDLDQQSNPFLMERLGINAVFNAGAIFFEGQYHLMCRVEGNDRKSFFALASSDNPVQGFAFKGEPILLPQTQDPDVNVYDMRLIQHEDGWIYGIFCSERKDPKAPASDTSTAVAQAGMIRTKDLKNWERLPDLKTPSPQQRNVVLHPEFIDGKYGLYTRPQDGFIEAGSGGGIAWAFVDSMENPVSDHEKLIDPRVYHTIKESKNGQGPAPIKTAEGWLHLAHGVRNTAAGLRYVLYLFVTDLTKPWEITHQPAGHLIAPQNEERVGDVSNVVFSNGWIAEEDGSIYLYYASSDTRLHVAKTSIAQLLDYAKNTPKDGLFSNESVKQHIALIKKNAAIQHSAKYS
jgi:4-O-beta-D-mannosyl-D-glucose phosphorylase